MIVDIYYLDFLSEDPLVNDLMRGNKVDLIGEAYQKGLYKKVITLGFDDFHPEKVFHELNVNITEEKYLQRKMRSMSVGDVIVANGIAYFCDCIGFKRLTQHPFPSSFLELSIHYFSPLLVKAG